MDNTPSSAIHMNQYLWLFRDMVEAMVVEVPMSDYIQEL